MKISFKAMFAFVLCVVMLFTSGCGTAVKDSATNPAPESTGTATEEGGKHYSFRIGCSNEAWRAENIIAAAEMLNKQLASEGSKDTVSVEYEVVDDFSKTFDLWIKEDNLPEFVARTSGDVYKYSKAGVIVDCSYVVNDEVYSEKVPQQFRDLGIMNGSYYGVVLDTEVRFVIVYKPALQKLGWTEEQIEAWKQEARAGKITTKDLQELAKKVVDAGICEYGITHRPNHGVDWEYTFLSWNGGKIPFNDKGQVEISHKAVTEFLAFWRENVQLGITPYNHLTDFNWDILEGDVWPNGKSFCWYGQVAAKSDIMSAGGVTSEYVDENYFTIPNPVTRLGDTPVGGSNPYYYALTTASQKDEKTAEYCRRILDNVLDTELQLNTSVRHAHIPITPDVLETDEYKNDRWMNDTDYMTKYIVKLPPDENLMKYVDSQELYDALQQAEVEANDPNAKPVEEIAREAIQKIIFNIGEGNYIIVD